MKNLKVKLAEHAGLQSIGKNKNGEEQFIGEDKEFKIFDELQNLDHDELQQSNFKF